VEENSGPKLELIWDYLVPNIFARDAVIIFHGKKWSMFPVLESMLKAVIVIRKNCETLQQKDSDLKKCTDTDRMF